MSKAAKTRSAQIRAGLSHPVIDADGHSIEFHPLVLKYIAEEGVAISMEEFHRITIEDAQWGPDSTQWSTLTREERHHRRATRPGWYTLPTKNTLDYATATLPALLHERLGDFGMDFSVVYPSMGLVAMHLSAGDLRRAACRALNRYQADAFGPYADRLTPVAVIPMHTPDEAITALDHAVTELGFKAVLLPSYVRRPIAAAVKRDRGLARYANWFDTYGIDSEYDYDPVWARCVELKVPASFHSTGMGWGWGTRQSISNWTYTHIGHFAAANEAVCKSLFLGGVTRRFPDLNFAFLEGGVGWACSLFADLISHWSKRNSDAIESYNPARLDREQFANLFSVYGRDLASRLGNGDKGSVAAGGAATVSTKSLANIGEDDDLRDEFAACRIARAEEIRDLFVRQFYFGCEPDDPMVATAFNERANPFGARLNAVFGSDIGHFDVPDMNEVLEEGWDSVEHGAITEDDFRDLVFTNPARFFTDMNPGFFEGTVVEPAVKQAILGPE